MSSVESVEAALRRLQARAKSMSRSNTELSMLKAPPAAAESDGDLRRAITRLDFVLRRPLADVDEQDASRVSDLHAVGRLLRAKRDATGALSFDPENLVQSMAMDSDACAAFVQFNCVEFFDDLGDLAAALQVGQQVVGRLLKTHRPAPPPDRGRPLRRRLGPIRRRVRPAMHHRCFGAPR